MLRKLVPSVVLLTTFSTSEKDNRVGFPKLEKSTSNFNSVTSSLSFNKVSTPSILIDQALSAREPPILPRPEVRILALDGGGVRGLFTAQVLHILETKLGHPLHEYFDIVSGTSTGGILALGLTIPALLDPGSKIPRVHTTTELLKIYNENAPDIFSTWGLNIYRAYYKYSPAGLEKLLAAHFGDSVLEDALATVIIPTINIKETAVLPLYSDHRLSHKVRVTELARATSAAPSYFPSAVLHYGGYEEKREARCVDGGVSVNNPARLALDKALLEYPNSKYHLLSIGTGEDSSDKINYKEWGAWWGMHIFDIAMQLQSSLVNASLDFLSKDTRQVIPFKYNRIQTILPRTIPLDATGRKDLDELILLAKSSKIEAQINDLVAELKEEDCDSRLRACQNFFIRPRKSEYDFESWVNAFIDFTNLKSKYDHLVTRDPKDPKRVLADRIFEICDLQAKILETLVQVTLNKQKKGPLDEFALILLNGAAHLRFRQAVVKKNPKPLEELANLGVPAAQAILEFYRFDEMKKDINKTKNENDRKIEKNFFFTYYNESKLKELNDLAQLDPLAALIYGFYELENGRREQAQQKFQLASKFPEGKLFAAIFESNKKNQLQLLDEAIKEDSNNKFARCVQLHLNKEKCTFSHYTSRAYKRQVNDLIIALQKTEQDKTWKWLEENSEKIFEELVRELRKKNTDRVEKLMKELSRGLLKNRTEKVEENSLVFLSTLLERVDKQVHANYL